MKSDTGEEDENVNKANAENTQHNQNKMFMGYITHLRNTWLPINKHKCPKYDDSILLIKLKKNQLLLENWRDLYLLKNK